MKLGCQTITFGEEQRDDFGSIFRVIRDAGYTGVEIGYRRFAGYDFARLRDLLSENSLNLYATHIGGNLEDTSHAAGERSVLDEILADLELLDVDKLMYSGLRYESDEQFASDLDMVRRSARLAADRGMKLLYHNHNWEFTENARVYRALVEEGGDDLGFCPDVGWIFKGGAPVLETLESVRDRIGVIHFKDFASEGTGAATETVDTVEFGNGVVPLEEIARWTSEHAADAVVIAEQDRTSIRPADAIAHNGRYLSSLFSQENE